MKKIFSMMVFVAAFALTSCDGRSSAKTAETDSLIVDTVAVLEDETPMSDDINYLTETIEQGDATQVKDAIGLVVSKIQELVNSKKFATAAAYATQVQEFVECNKQKLQEMNINTASITELVNMVRNLPAKAGETAGAAAEAVKADAKAAKEAVKAAAAQKVEEGKAKVNEKIEEATRKADQKIEEATRKADQKIEEATQKAVDKTNEAIDDAADKIREALGL